MTQATHKFKVSQKQPRRRAISPATRGTPTAASIAADSADTVRAGAKHSNALNKPALSRPDAVYMDRDIAYEKEKGVDDFVVKLADATPIQVVLTERAGVLGSLIKDLSKHMDLPASRLFDILGIPKATAEKKAAAGEMVTGRGAQAALGMVRLLGIAQEIVTNSTASRARDFDSAKWLGQWIERPQPSLGGRKPADLIDTPTGVELVARLLGSIESGAYQ